MDSKRVVAWAAGAGACAFVLKRLVRASRSIDFEGKSVLIFGGSRGLGLVMAREFASRGARVALAARSLEELERARADIGARGRPAMILQCDIRDRSAVDAAVEHVIRQQGVIDVLVNDAGIIQVGPLDHMSIADFEDALATHFWGPLFTIQAALPSMRRAGARRIVNISSIGGKIAVPHLLPYSASKFALTGLSEGLRAELAMDGFAVTTVCPGLMRTGSTYNARFKGQHRREFAWFHVAGAIPGVSIDARRAARQIVDACRHGDPELIITPLARLGVFAAAMSPNTMARVMEAINWFLPRPGGSAGDTARTGWQSVSRTAPSPLTTLADRASLENNELMASGSPTGSP